MIKMIMMMSTTKTETLFIFRLNSIFIYRIVFLPISIAREEALHEVKEEQKENVVK